LERRIIREQSELPTSELEELDMEEKSANPDIIVATHIRVNKQLVIQDSLPKTQLNIFDIADYKHHLTREIEKRDGFTNGWEVEKRTAFVKARHGRATRIPQTLSDFSIEEWDKVFSIIHDQSAR